MRRVEPPTAEEIISFYLPYHCIFKTVEQASKIRVVFDVSCRSSSGVSLNDALLVGSIVQQDLISILMRFRFFTYVITTDIIKKMYQQILVHPSRACREFSDAMTSLLMSIRMNSLPSQYSFRAILGHQMPSAFGRPACSSIHLRFSMRPSKFLCQ